MEKTSNCLKDCSWMWVNINMRPFIRSEAEREVAVKWMYKQEEAVGGIHAAAARCCHHRQT